MHPVLLSIAEHHSLKRTNQPIRIGIPFARGEVTDLSHLKLLDDSNRQISFQAKPTAHWDEQSIRWALFDFKASILANCQNEYRLVSDTSDQNNNPEPNRIDYQNNNDHIIINTGAATFHVAKNTFLPFSEVWKDNKKLAVKYFCWQLQDITRQGFEAIIEDIEFPENHEAQRSTFYFKGCFKGETGQSNLRFNATLTFFIDSALCEMEMTLHNPKAAKHKGGFWDLGDSGSEYFKSLSLSIKLDEQPEVHWKDLSEDKFLSIKGNSIRLYQDSSGGENWNHHIHIDKSNNSTVSFKGYQLSVDDQVITQGDRASPVFSLMHQQKVFLSASIKNFWQNFPKALSIEGNELRIEIFPETLKTDYELQGGEQKTHSVYLDFGYNHHQLEQLLKRVNITIPLEHYQQSQAMPWLPQSYQPNALYKLIREGIDGDRDFFWKREKSDEYGWRNFGELWADHETLEHGNDDSLVSHYNNQYDPIYGFARQYILTGDQRWQTLTEDLVRHVLDIDIYHTNLDRTEYNQGLFWHTDHYLDGTYCTHRTFSIRHLNSDHVEQSGGGPGTEHCYTSGLMMHYFMTGNSASKQAVIQLAKWAKLSNEGNNTLVERLIDFLRKDIPAIKRLLKKDYVFKYKFALSRATGNYLNTLLDYYLLETKPEILEKAANVIQETLSPNDPIDERQLMTDIESNWHYTVLLQSLYRYLYIKESFNELDEAYQYALASFKHYAKWVYDNEQPFLESADQLVYPNDTWVAQDLRKASILMIYTKYCDVDSKHKVLKKADTFKDTIAEHFSNTNNRTTRIMALLIQNNLSYPEGTDLVTPSSMAKTNASSKASILSVLYSFVKDMFTRVFSVKIKNEIASIKHRI
jgi:hypothetical protein